MCNSNIFKNGILTIIGKIRFQMLLYRGYKTTTAALRKVDANGLPTFKGTVLMTESNSRRFLMLRTLYALDRLSVRLQKLFIHTPFLTMHFIYKRIKRLLALT